MHTTRKPTRIPIQAPNPAHTPLRRERKRAAVAINALRVLAAMALLARRLARNHTQDLEVRLAEFVVVRVRALVRLPGIEVAAPDADVMLVAGLELLDALDFIAVVVEDVVEALAVFVALDRGRRDGGSGGADEVGKGLTGFLASDLRGGSQYGTHEVVRSGIVPATTSSRHLRSLKLREMR